MLVRLLPAAMYSRYIPWVLLLCLNVTAWYFFTRKETRARALAPASNLTAREQAPVEVAVTNEPFAPNRFEWAQLESEDYETYIERLRRIGCPEETIRDIIIADLEKLMAGRVREIDAVTGKPEYWKPSRRHLTSTVKERAKIGQKQEVEFEKREIVRQLLGIDLAAERARVRGERDFYDERLTFLPDERRGRVRTIMERANQEEMMLREKSWLEADELSAADKAELREIQRRKEKEIGALLSPEELEQFNLWFSPSAYRVREAFLALEPNEQEFLALYQMQRQFDVQWDGVEPSELDAEQRHAYTLAQQALEAGMREYLGAEKFEKMGHARDPDFRQLQRTAAQFGLNPEITGEIYDYRQALEEERKNVQANSALPSAQREAILRALNEETEQAVVEAMGPKAYRYYVRQGAGQWIWNSN